MAELFPTAMITTPSIKMPALSAGKTVQVVPEQAGKLFVNGDKKLETS
jgi:hypothetical protein